MRKVFVKTLLELAQKDERIMLLTGDLGFTVLEPFRDAFPKRFFNCGVAEQNMAGIAAGLAEAGFIPFFYSIVTFAVLRPYEFIRNGAILHQLPVRIVGVGGGFEYGSAGITHYGLEDIAVMRAQPGITVIAPADSAQARSAILESWNLPGPVYYRLSKDDRTVVSGLNGEFALGRAQVVRKGKDVAIISLGGISAEAAAAAEKLLSLGIDVSLVIIASVHPAPREDLARIISGHALVFTVEEHYINGGIGSLAAEVIAENGLSARLVRLGVKHGYNGISGSQGYMKKINGLSVEAICRAIQKSCRQDYPKAKFSRKAV